MKKYLSCLVIIAVFMFVGIANVSAASFGKISGGNTNGKSIKVQINDAQGFVFSYDSSSLSCGGIGTSVSNDPYGRLINENNVELTCTISTSDYKNLDLILVDPNNSKTPVSTTYEINVSKKTSSSTQTSTTVPTTTTSAPKSNNANLKTLVIKADDDSEVALSPSFNSSVYEYSANVASTIRTISVNATMEDAKANMVISNNANQELKAGENNKITITVTAEDGTKKAYVVNVKRDALTADATLKELTIEENKSFKLEEDKFNYTVKIKKNVKELTISYVLSDENASVSIEGNKNLKDGSKVKIIVTAEDGTKKVYTLNISKETTITKAKENIVSTEKNPLIIMGLSIIAFGLIGGIVYVVRK